MNRESLVFCDKRALLAYKLMWWSVIPHTVQICYDLIRCHVVTSDGGDLLSRMSWESKIVSQLSIERISKALGVTRQSVLTYIRELEKLGFVYSLRTQTGNLYLLGYWDRCRSNPREDRKHPRSRKFGYADFFLDHFMWSTWECLRSFALDNGFQDLRFVPDYTRKSWIQSVVDERKNLIKVEAEKHNAHLQLVYRRAREAA